MNWIWVQTCAAGEQAVTVGDLYDIAFIAARGDDSSGTAVLPHINVVLGVESDDAFAGRTGGGVDSDAVFQVGRKHSVGICFSQIVFAQERQLADIFQTSDILRLYAFFVHQVAIVLYILIDVILNVFSYNLTAFV